MTRPRSIIAAWVLISSLLSISLSAQESGSQAATEQKETQTERAAKNTSADSIKLSSKADKDGWRPLLPKNDLKGWEITDFGQRGEVSRDGDLLVVEMGDPLNGITYLGKDFPTDSFEIYLEVKRIEGSDFLCGLTFPVGKEFCSFIAGGWGGNLVGLSNVDGYDASENQTTTYLEFENDRWYKFRVRVAPKQIQTWIDGKEFFRLEREYHEFSTRIEVYASQPLGFCAYMSTVAVRDFKWRPLPKAETKADGAASDKADAKKGASQQ